MSTEHLGSMRHLRALLWGVGITSLMACSGSPDCHYRGAPASAPSAGCVVVHKGLLLLAGGRGGKYSVPGGSVASGESAQCGAERETWEETGIEVQARELAASFDNGFQLYWCDALAANPEIDVHRPLEIASADFVLPADFASLRWRFPDQAALLARMIRNQPSAD